MLQLGLKYRGAKVVRARARAPAARKRGVVRARAPPAPRKRGVVRARAPPAARKTGVVRARAPPAARKTGVVRARAPAARKTGVVRARAPPAPGKRGVVKARAPPAPGKRGVVKARRIKELLLILKEKPSSRSAELLKDGTIICYTAAAMSYLKSFAAKLKAAHHELSLLGHRAPPPNKHPLKLSSQTTPPPAEQRASVWCNLDQKEIYEMFLYYGLRKSTLNLKDDIPTPQYPNRLCNILHTMFPVSCTKKYSFVKFLGQGGFGHVYEVRDRSTGRRGAIKIQLSNRPRDMAREIVMQKKLHSIGVAPAVWDTCSMKTTKPSQRALRDLQERLRTEKIPQAAGQVIYLTVMAKIDGVLSTMLSQRLSIKQLDGILINILVLARKLEENRMTHGDLHPKNIGYVNLASGIGSMTLIDAGWTSDKVSMPEYDWTQLYRTLHKDYDPGMNEYNRDFLKDKIRRIVYLKYKLLLPVEQRKTEALWDKMSIAYQRKIGH